MTAGMIGSIIKGDFFEAHIAFSSIAVILFLLRTNKSGKNFIFASNKEKENVLW